MGRVLKTFRFDPELYAGFKGVIGQSGLMVTEAFERFMRARVEAGTVKLPDAGKERSGVGAKAGVLLAWLMEVRNTYWVYSEDEIRTRGKLLDMLSQVKDEALQKEIEEQLEKN